MASGCDRYWEPYEAAVWFGQPWPTKGLDTRPPLKDTGFMSSCLPAVTWMQATILILYSHNTIVVIILEILITLNILFNVSKKQITKLVVTLNTAYRKTFRKILLSVFYRKAAVVQGLCDSGVFLYLLKENINWLVIFNHPFDIFQYIRQKRYKNCL